MIKNFYFIIAFFFISISSNSQTISMIGDGVSGWSTDVVMSTTDNVNYTLSNFTFSNGGAKFRQNADWGTNWGASTFPSGIANLNGSNIPVTAGIYNVAFNRTTRVYSFTAVAAGFDAISISGSAGPGLNADVAMSTVDGVNYALDNYTLTAGTLVFRQNNSSTTSWGSANFPSGTATLGGSPMAVTAGTYNIKFNKTTGVYTFNFAVIGIIGSATANGWDSDTLMITSDGTNYTLSGVTLIAGELKFRQNQSWTINWGSNSFPAGTASLNGNNIGVVAGTYTVTFNRNTGVFNFSAGYPVVSLFATGGTDIDLITLDGINYYLNNYTISSGNYKFRQGHSSTITWGANAFPSGTATLEGPSIPVIAGDYDIKFNKTTGVFSFNYLVISVIGSATPGGWTTDTNMTTTDGINYKLTGLALIEGELKLRQGNDWAINWSGYVFPNGIANLNGSNIGVTSASNFTATFNRLTGAYYFYDEVNLQVNTPLNLCGSSVAAPLSASVFNVPGSILKWYTVATGGTASLTTPVQSTAIFGTTTYYVSQTIAGVEGPRKTIVVNVVGSARPSTIIAKYNNIALSSSAFGNFIGTSLPVELSVPAVLDATSYEWTFPTGVTVISGQNTNVVTVNFMNAEATLGTFMFTVKSVSASGCKSLARSFGGIKAIPSTPGAIISSLDNVCLVVGTASNVTYTCALVPGIVYSWTVPTGASIVSGQGTNSIVVNYNSGFTASGTFSVIASNSLGMSVLPRTLTVTRRLPSIPMVSVGQFFGICPAAGPYSYTLVGAPLFATSWTITGPVGSIVKSPSNASNTSNTITTSTDISFTVTYPNDFVSGVAAVMIQSTNGCAVSAIRTTKVYRNLATPASITGSNIIDCSTLGTPIAYSCPLDPLASSYNWTLSGIPGATIASGQGTNSVTIVFPTSLANLTLVPTASIRVTKSGTVCGNLVNSSMRSLIVTKPTCDFTRSIANQISYSELYPNPTTSNFNVDITVDKIAEVALSVYNFNGSIVSKNSHKLVEGKNTINTDLSSFPNGIYIVQFINPSTNNVETKKMVKR